MTEGARPSEEGSDETTRRRERERERDGEKRRRRRRRRRLEITVILKRGEIRGWFPWVAAICPLGAAKLQEAWPTGLWSLELAAVQPAPPYTGNRARFLFIDARRWFSIAANPLLCKRIGVISFRWKELVWLHVTRNSYDFPRLRRSVRNIYNRTTTLELKIFIGSL